MTTEPGLRERKKRETARAIEVAAVELAAELGLAETTVEAISARADVTSRTFFNYYAGKEDAVLGNSRAVPPPSLSDLQWRPGISIVAIVIDAVRDQIALVDVGDPELQRKRRELVHDNPQLLAKDFQSIGAIEADFVEQVARLLAEEGRVPAAEREDRAWAIVIFTGAVLRLAATSWSREGGHLRPLTHHIDAARELLLAVTSPETLP
ncbi:helix-turn-helix domain-containing protein [Herbiconiux sp. KACC 21604]|uniref:TetR/AcrR family transcriptional regulator n=1 Tax=unclassified Herbiconiux TaxID=2618217 RepID=UPI001491F479|nr:helix-turn-helix domain-containing protein [Herbiconiux sp. SALV-R1]QJU53182.1 TetR family transcriptional regulator [Herbiconiux sp. SALV-R1]WPO88130.1 helix-turn-helix domain-containing protein [Herbiconiux sp. KACC 21604]